MKKEKPTKTIIIRDKEIEGKDYCPFCGSKDLGHDLKKDIYLCFACWRTWIVGD